MSRSIQALNVDGIDLDGCRPHDEINGQHHAEHIFLAHQNTHYFLKGASLDSFGTKQSAAALVLRESISLSERTAGAPLNPIKRATPGTCNTLKRYIAGR
jgi:hypothetical protein